MGPTLTIIIVGNGIAYPRSNHGQSSLHLYSR